MHNRILMTGILCAVWLAAAIAWLVFGPMTFGMRAPFRSVPAIKALLAAFGIVHISFLFGWILPAAYCLYLAVFGRK